MAPKAVFICHDSTYPFCPEPDRLSPRWRRTHRALFVAYARHFGGSFVLRIEDTDLERSTPEAVQAIIEGMEWLGLHHDEGPFLSLIHI